MGQVHQQGVLVGPEGRTMGGTVGQSGPPSGAIRYNLNDTRSQAMENKIKSQDWEWVHIDTLHPWERNARVHSAESTARLSAGVRRFGFPVPITAWRSERRIAAGHGRRLAMHALLKEDPAFVPRNAPEGIGPGFVPVMWVDFATEAQFEAFALSDNRQAKNAQDDDALMAAVLADLDANGIDFDGMGFDADEIAALLASVEHEAVDPDESDDDDDVPGLVEETDSRQGQVYILGPHRLMCGDCRDSSVVAELLDGTQINLAFTSPPYACQRKYDETSGFKPIPPDDYVDWFDAVQQNVRKHLAEDGSWLVNIKEHCENGARSLYVKDLTLAHVRRWQWRFIDELVWRRAGMPGIFRERFKNQWEPVFHFAAGSVKFNPDDVRESRELTTARFSSDPLEKRQGKTGGNWRMRTYDSALPGNVLECAKGSNAGRGHSAAFPVALPDFFIRAFSDEGDAVYDPFLGSGTTLIAAAKNGRVAYGCEISEGYCDLIRRRWTQWAIAHNVDPGPGALAPVEEG